LLGSLETLQLQSIAALSGNSAKAGNDMDESPVMIIIQQVCVSVGWDNPGLIGRLVKTGP
jgi:hypothetical protein